MPASPPLSAAFPSNARRVLAWPTLGAVLIVLGLSPTAIGAAVDDGRSAVRWWDDAAVAMLPAANVARFAVLSEVSDDQFAAWLGVLDAHQAAIDALVAEAEASGPVVHLADDDGITNLRRRIDALERRASLRRKMEPLRDQLFAGLLEPLTERQRVRAMQWRNLIVLEVELVRPELMGVGSIEWVALDETLADMTVADGDSDRLGALLSATADSRRAMAVELGVRGGGFNAITLREMVAALEAGTEWGDAFAGVAQEPTAEVRARLQTMDRYRALVLQFLRDLDGLGVSRSFVDEAKARILARADPNLASPGSVVAGAAGILSTESANELTDEDRAELERRTDAVVRAMIEHARTAPSGFAGRAAGSPGEGASRRGRALWDSLEPHRSQLRSQVQEQGGTFPTLESSMSRFARPSRAQGAKRPGGATDAVSAGEATSVVATALAPDLGWTREEALATAAAIAGGQRVREVAAWPDTDHAGLATDLLQAVADGERTLIATREALTARRGRRFGPVAPTDRWGHAPLTGWVLSVADEHERTAPRLRRLLEFERARSAGLDVVRAAAEAAGPIDEHDVAAISAEASAMERASKGRDALMTAALADVTGDAPRLMAAVHEAIDRQRIGWMLARHQALEALLAEIESELRLDPARRLALIDAGTALRAVARRANFWAGDPSDPVSMTARGHIARAFIAVNRVWTRHAFAAEVIGIRRELLRR